MTLPTAVELPASLVEYDQWVCWREESRGEKPTKIPVNPHTGRYASSTDRETWGSFETARAYAVEGSADGIGFVFCEKDSFVGVDLDDARDPETETPADWAKSIIDELNSYTEVSPSGTGYHVLLEGNLPPGRNRRGGVELYEHARFFTVTGDHVETTPSEIIERTTALAGVYADHVADEHETQDQNEDASESESLERQQATRIDTGESGDQGIEKQSRESESSSSSDGVLLDEELLSKARGASNGAKFERLWRGNTSGYDSHSEADMALACLLAFWSSGDTRQMDRLFRRSGLMREKWEAVHYADGQTYGETTLKRAVSVTTDHYTPRTEQTTQRQDSQHEDYEQADQENNNQPSSIQSIEADSSTEAPTGAGGSGIMEESTVYAREKERIETIRVLEQQLRELEQENESLRHERNEERAKRKQLLDDTEPDAPSRITGWLRRILT
ncbi:hypothetical protein Halar_0333 (plasmid) [halophilic archaeon DL31]|nr:hypothetical protein Halar_0333 [halophilic archaeon DL31]